MDGTSAHDFPDAQHTLAQPPRDDGFEGDDATANGGDSPLREEAYEAPGTPSQTPSQAGHALPATPLRNNAAPAAQPPSLRASQSNTPSTMLQHPKAHTHRLVIRQQPLHSRMCGFGEKVDRRPVDPPPIIQLEITSSGSPEDVAYLYNPYYFMYASLFSLDSDEEVHILHDGKTRSTTGSIVSSLYRLRDLDNVDGAFFVFPDLSVRMEGSYRLKFSLFEIINTEMYYCTSIISNPFHVYSAKKFPGMEESTFLSKAFAEQGLKIRIRKELRVRKAVKRESGGLNLMQMGDFSNDRKKRPNGAGSDDEDGSDGGSEANDHVNKKGKMAVVRPSSSGPSALNGGPQQSLAVKPSGQEAHMRQQQYLQQHHQMQMQAQAHAQAQQMHQQQRAQQQHAQQQHAYQQAQQHQHQSQQQGQQRPPPQPNQPSAPHPQPGQQPPSQQPQQSSRPGQEAPPRPPMHQQPQPYPPHPQAYAQYGAPPPQGYPPYGYPAPRPMMAGPPQGYGYPPEPHARPPTSTPGQEYPPPPPHQYAPSPYGYYPSPYGAQYPPGPYGYPPQGYYGPPPGAYLPRGYPGAPPPQQQQQPHPGMPPNGGPDGAPYYPQQMGPGGPGAPPQPAGYGHPGGLGAHPQPAGYGGPGGPGAPPQPAGYGAPGGPGAPPQPAGYAPPMREGARPPPSQQPPANAYYPGAGYANQGPPQSYYPPQQQQQQALAPQQQQQHPGQQPLPPAHQPPSQYAQSPNPPLQQYRPSVEPSPSHVHQQPQYEPQQQQQQQNQVGYSPEAQQHQQQQQPQFMTHSLPSLNSAIENARLDGSPGMRGGPPGLVGREPMVGDGLTKLESCGRGGGE
ncbi:hypothetical protein HDU98_006305 [Podochytrium sp. JEL0797]|nr:hypothetical protein HDU98_006305 [Podochytrium sp. JEL0797]